MSAKQVMRRRSSRRGTVAILVALCLTLLVGVVAIALEGGLRLSNHRRVQAAADAAALAAAAELYRNYPYMSTTSPDPGSRAATKANASVGSNLPGEPYTVEVSIPPKTGLAKGQLGSAEVVVHYAQPRYFSRIWGNDALPISARAVARGKWAELRNGIIVLDPHESETLKANGTVKMRVKDANVVNNSNDPQATGGDGAGATIEVINAAFHLSGGVKSNTTLIGEILNNRPPIPDPLAHLPEPEMPATTQKAGPPKRGNDPTVQSYLQALGIAPDQSRQVWILEPGRYDQMPNFTNMDVVILKQASANGSGIYYLNNTGFSSLGATVAVDPTGGTTGGVMLYNDPTQTARGISIAGGAGAVVNITPLRQGIYRGVTLFQKRSVTSVPLSISGQGSMAMTGTFYTAGGEINVQGNDSTGLNVLGSQYISRTLSVGGNGKFNVNWNDDTSGRTRLIGFVE